MITAKELYDWSEDIRPVLTDINTSINNLRIIKIENANNLPEVRHKCFQFLWHQQRFVLIVQLAKLFCNNELQKRNIHKLCKRFEENDFDDEIKNLLKKNSTKLTDVFRSREDVLIYVSEIKKYIQENKDLIKKIKTLRNKVFAHTDPDKVSIKLTNDELEGLVTFANDVYNSLFGKIFDRHFFLEITKEWDLRYIIEIIKNNH